MKTMTLKEKEKVVKAIYQKYQKAELDSLYFHQHQNYYPHVDLFKVKESSHNYHDAMYLRQLERKNDIDEYIDMVHVVHSHLSEENKFFMQREYISSDDRLWWMDYYSKASYYRTKHKAIDEFLLYASGILIESNLVKT